MTQSVCVWGGGGGEGGLKTLILVTSYNSQKTGRAIALPAPPLLRSLSETLKMGPSERVRIEFGEASYCSHCSLIPPLEK